MPEQDLETAIQVLVDRIDQLPRQQQVELKKAVEDTRRRHEEITSAARRAREALDDYRLFLKYLLFDVEATRREARARLSSPFDESAADES